VKRPGPEVLDRARSIRLVLLDSDGVLTDGRIVVGGDGADLRSFDVRDGMGIRIGREGGLEFGVVSGRECRALTTRAAELGIDELHQGVTDKLERVCEILDRRGVAPRHACFVGDDLNDVPAMQHCGLAVAPADAVDEVRELAHWVTSRGGGRGAVREVVELVLRAAGRWDASVAGVLGRH